MRVCIVEYPSIGTDQAEVFFYPQELAAKIFRGIAILQPQLIIILDQGAKNDLLFGFNRTDAGFSILLALLIVSPVITLAWFVIETIRSVRLSKKQGGKISLTLPGLALLFFLEALVIDFYMVLHFRM